ncbi:MAG: MASE1 domain-containing protein [Candidatus Berkiella sp.]
MTSKTEQFKQFSQYLVQHNVIAHQAKDCYKKYYKLFFLRRLAEFMLSSVFIYVGINFLILSKFNLPLWPATGAALSIAFLRGHYAYFGFLIGAMSAFYIHSSDILFSFFQAFGFTFYIYLMRTLLLRWVGAIQPLDSSKVVIKFIGIVAILTLTHIIYTYMMMHIFNYKWPFDFKHIYIHWLSELNGILCLTPFTLAFDPFVSKKYFSFNRRNYLWFVSTITIIALHLSFIWLDTPVYIACALGLLLISICIFAYQFSKIPSTILLLGLGLLYLAGITDYTSNIFTTAYISETYLAIICLCCLIITTSQSKKHSFKA